MKYRNNSQIQKVLMFLLTTVFVVSTLFGALFIGNGNVKAVEKQASAIGSPSSPEAVVYKDGPGSGSNEYVKNLKVQTLYSGEASICFVKLTWTPPTGIPAGETRKLSVWKDGQPFQVGSLPTTETSSTIPNLECGKNYRFTVATTDPAGIPVYALTRGSAEISFTLATPALNPAYYPVSMDPIQVKKTGPNNCSALISWKTHDWANVTYTLQVGPKIKDGGSFLAEKMPYTITSKEISLPCEKAYVANINLFVSGTAINKDAKAFTMPAVSAATSNTYVPTANTGILPDDYNNLPSIVTNAPTTTVEDNNNPAVCAGGWFSRHLGLFGDVLDTVSNPIGKVTCVLLEGVKDFGGWVNSSILGLATLDFSSKIMPGGTYWNVIHTPWSIAMGIAYGFVALILIVLAIISIAHIQYDTYQIKKSLPLLITGVILSAFSMVIIRMLLSAADSVTLSFAGDPQAMITKVLGGLGINGLQNGINNDQIAILTWVGNGVGALTAGTIGLGMLALGIILMLISVIAVLVLVFILYIRIAMIVILTITAPIAFIALAFPPTQGIFKMWWSEAIKWVFLQTILFFILWAASAIAGVQAPAGNGAIAIWMITIALVFFAFTVPFKLGGAIMAGWGGILAAVSGTGKGGYARKPAEEWAGKNLETMKGAAGKTWRGTKMGSWMADNNAKIEELLRTQKSEKEGDDAAAKLRMGKVGDELAVRRSRATNATRDFEAKESEDLNKIEQGIKLENMTDEDYERLSKADGSFWEEYKDPTTGKSKRRWVQSPVSKSAMDVAQSNFKSANRLNTATNALTKRRDIDINLGSISSLKEHNAVAGAMKDDLREEVPDIDLTTGLQKVDVAGKGLTIKRQKLTATDGKNGIAIVKRDSTGAYLKGVTTKDTDNMVTYAELTNIIAEFKAKAKAATTDAERDQFNSIADEYEGQAQSFKTTATIKYNYEAILDRNTYGRRLKEINPRIMEEADVTFLSSTGESVISDIDGKNGFGTSEYRATAEDFDKAAQGRWSELEDTAAFAVMQHMQAVQKFMVKGASGDVEGISAMSGFVNRVQQARGATSNFKVEVITKSMNQLSTGTPATLDAGGKVVKAAVLGQKETMQLNILAQNNSNPSNTQYADWAAVEAAKKENELLSNVDMQTLAIDNTKSGTSNRAFLQRIAFNVHNDDKLGLQGSPGSPVGDVRSNAMSHTHN